MKPKKLRCIVFGTGSIGKRLIKNIRAILGDRIDIIAYKTTDRDSDVLENELGVRLFYDLKKAFDERPDFAIISNPTSMHVEYCIKAAEHKCHLFIEKPVSDSMKDIEKLKKIVKKNKLITFVAYCLRFSRPICTIKKILDSRKLGKIISAEIHCGSYLPDWHPEEDYRKSCSAKKALGGGALLDLSHEIDYAEWLFGNLKVSGAKIRKTSGLEIETEDTADIRTVSDKGAKVNIHVDYIERPAKRFCWINCGKGELYWDNHKNSIEITDRKTGRKKSIDVKEDWSIMYKREIEHFLDCIKKKKQTMIPLKDGIKTIQIVLKAKKMAGWK